MAWSDYGGESRLQVARIDEWQDVKQLIDIPIEILDAYLYEEPAHGKYAAHQAVRFAFVLAGDDSIIYGSSCSWTVPVRQFTAAIADGRFPGRVPTVFRRVDRKGAESYYVIRDPESGEAPAALPAELPYSPF